MSVLNTPMDNCNNEVIGSLCAKLKLAQDKPYLKIVKISESTGKRWNLGLSYVFDGKRYNCYQLLNDNDEAIAVFDMEDGHCARYLRERNLRDKFELLLQEVKDMVDNR